MIVDGEETDWEDLGAVIAENVKITVKDDNLYKVNIEDGVTLNDDLSGLTEYNLEFESEEGNPREIPLHIEDLAGNEIDFSFLLINPNDERTEPEIQIDEIGTVFVGTDYDFTRSGGKHLWISSEVPCCSVRCWSREILFHKSLWR